MTTVTRIPNLSAANADGRPLECPVDEVILLEDRAHVIRRGLLEVPAGTTRLIVREVAPVIADRTLCGALRRPTGGGDEEVPARIQDLRVRRRTIARIDDRPEERRALERAMIELGERKGQLEVRRVRATDELAETGAQAQQAIIDVGVDASWGAIDPGAWEGRLAELGARELALRELLVALDEDLREIGREIERLGARLQRGATVRDEVAADLIVEIVARVPGRFAVQLDYIVPGACWRPYHRAELLEGEAQGLRFECEGCVWQSTGEDWKGVQLVFSTERPSLGTEPPRLTSDVLYVQRRSEVIEVEARDQEIQTAGLGGEPRKQAKQVPGIDDGGEALVLRAPRRADVPADGQPHRVPLFEFTAPAKIEHVLMPELAAAVILKSTQQSAAPHPILAGPVDLVRRGGFVGRTSILFIAPQERFSLGWGPDGAIRVLRELDQTQEEARMLSSWVSVDHKITLRLSNLGDEPRAIHVTERVPVSEIDKVKIEVDAAKTSERKTPDAEGMIEWDVALGPFERKKLELRYVVRRHGDVTGL
ncbi:MAG: DUF4139 domain-containing protein [Nannocystaceae bacterium]